MRLDGTIEKVLRGREPLWENRNVGQGLDTLTPPGALGAFALAIARAHRDRAGAPGLRFFFCAMQAAWLGLVAYLYLG